MATAGLKIWKWVLCHSKVNSYHCWVKQFFWSTYFPRISDKISRIHFSVTPIFQKLIKYTAGMNLPPGSLVWDFLEGHGVQNTHIDVTSYALVYTACSDYMKYRFFYYENSKAQKLCQRIEIIWGHTVQIHNHLFQNLKGEIFLIIKIRF